MLQFGVSGVGKPLDLTGQKFGNLTALEMTDQKRMDICYGVISVIVETRFFYLLVS